MFLSQGDGVLSDNSLPCRGVSSDEHGVAHFKMVDRMFLEIIKFKWVLAKNERLSASRDNTDLVGHVGYKLVKILHW